LVHRSNVCDAALPIDVFSDGDNYDFSHSAVEKGLCSEDPYIALQYAMPWVHDNRDMRNVLGSNLLRCVFGNPFHYSPPANLINQPINPDSLVQRFAKGFWEILKVGRTQENLTKVDFRNYTPPTTAHRPPPKHLLQAQSWLTSDVLALARQM